MYLTQSHKGVFEGHRCHYLGRYSSDITTLLQRYNNSRGTSTKAPSAKLPNVTMDMTKPQFRKFVIDWAVFKQITGLSGNQILVQLYSCCDKAVQNSIVNTTPDIFAVTEERLLKEIESTVTKQANPSVHRMTFASII